MAKKSKTPKKIGGKKLEDRIAPGMVGGGLVDPGMVDAVELDTDTQTDQSAGEVTETQMDSAPEGEAPADGQYLDEANAGEPVDAGGEEAPQEHAEDFNAEAESDYDEFAQDDVAGENYSEDAPTWQEPDWVTANADGSIQIDTPEGVSVDGGIATFSVDAVGEELPLPEGMEYQTDGSMNVQLPEGTEYLQESNQLLMPEGSVTLDEIPEEMNAYEAPQGGVMVTLPDDGFEFDAESNTLNVDNYHVNEMAPENVDFNTDGTVSVDLPEDGVEYNDDGSMLLSPEAGAYLDNPPPEYYGEMDCAEFNADGSMTIQPPEGVEVDGGLVTMDAELANEHLPIDDHIEFHADGTADLPLPEGAEYLEDINGIQFPEGEMNLDEIPEGIDAHVNPDGTTTVMLAEGMEYNGETNSVHVDNYWANEITPDHMELTPEGQVNIALPEDTQFYDDGSFQISGENLDYMEAPAPDYVYDAEWTEAQPDGSYQVQCPEEFNVNAEAGTVEVPYDAIDAHVPVDDHIEFHQDGSMTVGLPEGTTFDAAANTITMPGEHVSIEEIPEKLEATLNDDGSVTVALQDGMSFDAEAGSVHMDNYWTNELTPDAVEVHENGSLEVNLPQDTEFHDDGSFTLSESSADFLENPDPGYVAEGPEWTQVQPDGSVYVENFDSINVDAEAGNMSMETEYFNEQFDNHIPDDVTFNADGTMDIGLPEGTTYDADANALNFQAGDIHMDEIPEQVEATLNPDGSVTVHLQDGMEFNGETNSVHMDNYWTNELTPDAVEFHEDGQMHVDLPHDTHYYDDGSFQIPENSVDFIDEPCPEYVEHGPDWVSDNPDGSVTVEAPESMNIDSELGTVSMSIDTAMTELGGDLIPEEVTLHADGTASIGLPEGTTFDADANALTFAPGEMHIHELPEGIEGQLNADGSITVPLPEGISYDADANSVNLSNEMINQMAPEPINITPDGQFQIELPEDTQYFEGNSFVISAESADFMDDHGDHDHEGEQQGTDQYAQAS